MAKKRNLNAEIDRRLTDAGIPHYSEPIYRVSASAFTKAIRRGKASSGKNAWMVDLHSKSEYKGMKTYLSRDGKAGVAITRDGDVVSVFSAGKAGGAKPNAMGSLIPFAVEHGGRKLDCYAVDSIRNLPNLYARYGARATGKVSFDPEYAPPGWDGVTKPKVVAMTLPRSLTGVINSYNNEAKVDLKKVKSYRSYDRMLAARDRELSGASSLLPNMG